VARIFFLPASIVASYNAFHMQQLSDTTKPARASVEGSAHALVDVALPVNWFVRRHMRGFRQGLSVPQFRALVFVDTQPDASLSALADFVGSSIPTASRLISGLVRRNLVRRQGCTRDRRQVELALTCRGQSVLRTAWTGIQDCVAKELRELSPAQCQLVTSAMDVIRGVFGEVGLARFDEANGSAPTMPKAARQSRAAGNGRNGVAGLHQLSGAANGKSKASPAPRVRFTEDAISK
jgi:DNA-binding MarR family transcriptional regulator